MTMAECYPRCCESYSWTHSNIEIDIEFRDLDDCLLTTHTDSLNSPGGAIQKADTATMGWASRKHVEIS
tara:strand:- start:3976 stop:4182 length:207 start_codon:yes stop_codon:yes gene_type:complete